MNSMQPGSQSAAFDIAIIGMAGRFPGARNVPEFWANLCAGVESISRFSESELREAGVPENSIRDSRYIRAGAVIEDATLFDAAFFEINPKEAELLDPQHRIFLECAWEALEDAGYDTEQYAKDIGLYGGVSFHPYLWSHLWIGATNELDAHLLKINLSGSLTGRVSYKLNLRGPSLTIQSGCSTSLVAVHIACQGLLAYECDMALAGGVSIDPERKGYLIQEGALSPDGHTRAFDAKAQGMVGGNGVGLVVLKRLDEAVADGDHIYGVIKGSAVNNDGSMKIGFAAPSVQGQTRAILAAQAVAGVNARTISYIETHGTGTPLGDSIELKALGQAFRASTVEKQFCAIGSVKTNVGHLDNAAGVTGLIKTALCLHHKLLPPSLNFESPHPEFNLADSPFYVNTVTREWTNGNEPRRAAVSSFGIGGTNAHAVLEEAPPAGPAGGGSSRSWQLLVMSARTGSALEAATAQLSTYLRQHPAANLADVAYTCQVGRRAFNHCRMLVCRDAAEAVEMLETQAPQRVFTSVREPVTRPLAFMFPGGGAQYQQMARGLYLEERTFREEFDTCAELLEPELGFDLRCVLYPAEGADQATAAEQLRDPSGAMCSVFAVEYALARLFLSWGLTPDAVIGHSFGEYTAATLAGVFSVRDALRLLALRGRLFAQLDEGAMLSVPLPEEELMPLLLRAGGQLSLAAVNGPSRCVVSGAVPAVAELEAILAARRVNTSRLQTNRAGHSPMVDAILQPFARLVSQFKLNPPTIPLISNVTGTWMTAAEATDPDYWVSHLRRTVRFSDGVRELVKEPARILLEVGPGQALSSLVRRQLKDKRRQLTLASLRDPDDKCPDVAFLLNALGKLWLAGVQINWSGFNREAKRQRLSLPTYPFERQRYWRAGTQPGAQALTVNSRPAASSGVANHLYAPGWKRTAAPRTASPGRQIIWLVFMDEAGLGDGLVERLERARDRVVVVRAGEVFRREGDRAYRIDPHGADAHRRLLSELDGRGEFPEKIIHLRSLGESQTSRVATAFTQDPTGRRTEERTEGRKTYDSDLLSLAAALRERNLSAPLQLFLVLNDSQEVTGDESVRPERAMMSGLFAALAAELPSLSCRSIDLQLTEADGRQKESLVEQVFDEVTTGDAEPLVAYRGRYRWVRSHEPVDGDVSGTDAGALREGGVYLIVNGLEGLGLRLAEYLARNARARLILTAPVEHSADDLPSQSDSAARGVRGVDGSHFASAIGGGRLAVDLASEAERIVCWQDELDEASGIKPIESYDGLEADFNALCASHICAFLKSGGINVSKGARGSREEMAKSLRIPDRFKHFTDLFVEELAEDGVVRADEDGLEFLIDPSEMAEPQQLAETLNLRYPEFASSFWFLEHCFKNYPGVFSGKVSPGSVLYPDGSYDMLKRLGNTSVETSKSPVYRNLLARIISELATRTAGKLRILEVGGGMGLLTELILNALPGRRVEYHFTDIGRSFVVNAEKKASWRELADLRFGMLDISSDPGAQGYEKESYDLIVAFDVVQATTDILKSLSHLRSLLAPGGALFLLQTLKAFRWQHLTFGFSPGWWNFKEDPLRGTSPVLSLAAWESVLEGFDFASVRSYPRNMETRSGAEFGLLIAQRGGENPALISQRQETIPARYAPTLEALRKMGAEVFAATVDAGDLECLREAVTRASLRFKELDGAFYVARAVAETDDAGSDRALPEPDFPPGYELPAFDRALPDKSLDCCLLLAPMSARPGTARHTAEAAAAHYMEAYADLRNRHGAGTVRGCSSWNLRSAAGATITEGGESPAAGAETEQIFRRLFALRPGTHLLVSREDPRLRGAGAPDSVIAGGVSRVKWAPVSEAATEPAPATDSPGGSPQEGDELEQAVARIWQELLGAAVSRHQNFFELGGDSLIALQVISRMRDTMGVEITIAELLERQTTAELTHLIRQRLTEPGADTPPESDVYQAARGVDDLDDLLSELEHLSNENIQALLTDNADV